MLVPLSQKTEISETVTPVVRSLSGCAFVKGVGLIYLYPTPEPMSIPLFCMAIFAATAPQKQATDRSIPTPIPLHAKNMESLGGTSR